MRSRSLEHLRRVRMLVEELAQRELAHRIAKVRRLEEAAGQEQSRAAASRREALEGLEENGEREKWLLGLADAEILEWRSHRLRGRAEEEKPLVTEARTEMLERRKERLQVETLVETARRTEEQERNRREQQRLDDSYQRVDPGRRQED